MDFHTSPPPSAFLFTAGAEIIIFYTVSRLDLQTCLFLAFIGPCIIVIVDLLFHFSSYVLNMFRTLTHPSSGSCDCAVELPHWSFCSRFIVCWRFGVAVFEWCPCCRLKLCIGDLVRLGLSSVCVAGWSCASGCNTDTTQTQPHQISNTQWTENKTTDVVIQQHSRKILMMDMLMSETCRVHQKWNKIASDIKLVFHSSTLVSYPFGTRDWTPRAQTWSATLHLVPVFRICGATVFVHPSTQVCIHTGRSRPPWTSCLTLTCLTTRWILPMHIQGSWFDLQCLKLHWGCFLCSRPTLVCLVNPQPSQYIFPQSFLFRYKNIQCCINQTQQNPNTIINIIKFCCVWLIYIIVYLCMC